jgi:hypothetical protein
MGNGLRAHAGGRRRGAPRRRRDLAQRPTAPFASGELEAFIDVVKRSGVRVAVVSGGDYDLTTPEGRFTARIVGAVARKESEDRSRRVRRKHLERAEQGRPASHLGWDVRDEAERELVREAAGRVLARQGLITIARDWNCRGVPGTTASLSGSPWATRRRSTSSWASSSAACAAVACVLPPSRRPHEALRVRRPSPRPPADDRAPNPSTTSSPGASWSCSRHRPSEGRSSLNLGRPTTERSVGRWRRWDQRRAACRTWMTSSTCEAPSASVATARSGRGWVDRLHAQVDRESKQRIVLHPGPRRLWTERDFGQRRDLVRLVVERVRVMPARRGARFDPGRVRLDIPLLDVDGLATSAGQAG